MIPREYHFDRITRLNDKCSQARIHAVSKHTTYEVSTAQTITLLNLPSCC